MIKWVAGGGEFTLLTPERTFKWPLATIDYCYDALDRVKRERWFADKRADFETIASLNKAVAMLERRIDEIREQRRLRQNPLDTISAEE